MLWCCKRIKHCPAHHSAKLPHNDAARLHTLAAIHLHAASLRIAVPPVLCRAACIGAGNGMLLGGSNLLFPRPRQSSKTPQAVFQNQVAVFPADQAGMFRCGMLYAGVGCRNVLGCKRRSARMLSYRWPRRTVRTSLLVRALYQRGRSRPHNGG